MVANPADRDPCCQGRQERLFQTFRQPWIKGVRGLDCFLLRGLKKASAEWAQMATTHYNGKLHRAALAAA